MASYTILINGWEIKIVPQVQWAAEEIRVSENCLQNTKQSMEVSAIRKMFSVIMPKNKQTKNSYMWPMVKDVQIGVVWLKEDIVNWKCLVVGC